MLGGWQPRSIYITEAEVTGCPSCSFLRGDILQHSLPEFTGGWVTRTTAGDGSNLRSDDKYLYYRDAGPGPVSIKRLSSVPVPYEFDLAADGLEVVQESQDLNNSVRLVADRTTFVRGYARVVKDSTGASAFYPTARLMGWDKDGTELPGSRMQDTG